MNESCGAPATGNSVWYKFTAQKDGNIFVDAFFSNYNAGVIVATGTPGALTTVSCGPFEALAPTTAGRRTTSWSSTSPAGSGARSNSTSALLRP